MPIQQLMLGAGGAAEKSYADDMFNSYLWAGNASTRTISTGLNMGKGGMVWIKGLNIGSDWVVGGTGLGDNHCLAANTTGTKDNQTSKFKSLTSSGFQVGNDNEVNNTSYNYVGNSFRKSKGFFDVVTYTGNGADRTIAHSLGCIPGFIMIKCTSASRNWQVYHSSLGGGYALKLDATNSKDSSAAYWNNSEHTSTHFSLGYAWDSNKTDETYIAYLFAGGESTAATAKSVNFDGNDYLTIPAHSDLDFGSGNFTIECWFRVEDNTEHQSFLADFSGSNYQVEINDQGYCQFAWGANSTSYWSIVGIKQPAAGVWNHIAVVRNGNVFTQYLNGTFDGTFTSATSANTNGTTYIGRNSSSGRYVVGDISNVRIIKGTALYTSDFIPSTTPLTNVTNTKLLCCNDSSETGSTVTPDTITANGNPTAIAHSPFDDPANFIFGENEDSQIIKCGSYVGDGNSGNSDGNDTSHEVYLGWEPQWLLIKRTSSAESWILYDAMRDIVNYNGAHDGKLEVNTNDTESLLNHIQLLPTGFTFTSANQQVNAEGSDYVYVAIRRPDGYVGKPVETATDVFNVTLGNGSATIPSLPCSFPVDFCLYKDHANSGSNWATTARMTGPSYMKTNLTDAEAGTSEHAWRSMGGCHAGTWLNSNDIGYLWKRHAGFDVVTYVGKTSHSRQAVPHGLGKTPEMIWVKARTDDDEKHWIVYHHGLNGGSSPEDYYIRLNETGAQTDSDAYWLDTAPTSTHFTVGSNQAGNTGNDYIALLWASIPGFSKVGYYTGQSSDLTITLGFQPRFFWQRRVDGTGNWHVLDTTRGWGSGNDKYMGLEANSAQGDYDFGAPTSTGLTLAGGADSINNTNKKYIYNAHA